MITGVIIQARMGSERLPEKILRPLGGKEPMLAWVVERCRRSRKAEWVVVATTENPRDVRVVDFCKQKGYDCFQGDETDILSRYLLCADAYSIDTIVRITADCPFISPEIIDRCIELFYERGYDYVHNTRSHQKFPRGLDVEVVSREVLRRVGRLAKKASEKEHVTLYIYEHAEAFSIGRLEADPHYDAPELRLTVDTQEDLELAHRIAKEFQSEGTLVDSKKIIHFLKGHPEIAALNQHIQQKAVDGKII